MVQYLDIVHIYVKENVKTRTHSSTNGTTSKKNDTSQFSCLLTADRISV